MSLTIIKELPLLHSDQGVQAEVLSKTPEPHGIRPAQHQTNSNRVAAVNRLLQNGLNVPLAHDKPLQQQVTPANRERAAVLGNGRPISANRQQDNIQQHIQTATFANQSIPQSHTRIMSGNSIEMATSKETIVFENSGHEVAGKVYQLREARSFPYLHQTMRLSGSQERQPANSPNANLNRNEKAPSPPKVIQTTSNATLPANTQHPNEQTLKIDSNAKALLTHQSRQPVPISSLRMDVRQPIIQTKHLPVHNKSLQQRSHHSHQNPQVLNYPKKLLSLGRKIDQIVAINESLEARIEVMREHQENKDRQSMRLRNKVTQLNEKLRQVKKEGEDIESAGVLHRSKLEEEITKIRQSSSDTIARMQAELAQARSATHSLEQSVRTLEKECRQKDRQLAKYRDFFLQMQSGFDSMRDRPLP